MSYPGVARFVAGLVVATGHVAAQPLTRVAATSLRLPAVPPPTSYTTARVWPALSFNFPVALVSPPGDTRRLFVVEKVGRIWVIPDVTAASPSRTLFLDLASRVATNPADASDERGLLALAFHPAFATNGQFYVWWTLNTTTAAGTGLHDRLSRFRVSANDPNVAEPTSEQPLLSQRDEAGNHNGGQLAFGPDGYLYLSVGDEGNADDTLQNSQRIDKDFFSGMFRLDVDQRPGSLAPHAHAAVHAGTYAVPPDNPFVGATAFNGAAVRADAVRTEFWATGLRNPWRFSFDSATGRLWCADVGQGAREEIDLIVRGGNYGWNYREGTIAGPRASPPAASATTFLPPVWDYARAQGSSVTGGLVYRGPLHAALHGKYLFADFVSGRIWALDPDGDNPVPDSRVQLLATDSGIASFGLNPATGDILLADLTEGSIRRLVPGTATGGTQFPATLSATGVFSATAALTPAAGVVAYEPNVSFWSDHARKRRWFALPDTASRFGFAATGNWSLPAGAVWVKHFDLELTRGDPATARRVETRLLVKTATGVYGLGYRWNDTQTDATLVPDAGADADFDVVENGAPRTQTWRFPSRAECLACHTERGGFALSFNTRQLDRTNAFPGGTANTVAALAQAGYLDIATAPPSAALPALAAADDARASIEARARSYLDANCAQCHQPGGTALGAIDARASTPLSLAGLIDGALLDTGADPANRVIVPGDAARSRLLHRLAASHGAARMPPIATRERDLAAESLLTQWIAALASPQPASRLINLATRAQAGNGPTALIAGFVIEPGAARTVLLRAIGPSLTQFGVSDALASPVLTLFNASGRSVARNTRWSTDDADLFRATSAQAGAFPVPEGSFDSGLVVTLVPGDYSAQVTGARETAGVALLEVYAADSFVAPAARLINLSVRAHVGTGAQILIPGLVVGPGAAKTVLIRAVGPGLAPFNVAGFLAQPVLTLYHGTEAFRSNTRWNTAANAADIRTAAQRVAAFPLAEGGADSALLVSLSPGPYTLQVGGANDTTGVALVEVYEVP
ncbi:MAG: PQQ-dependent sugar dehydrogenase [Verrucomicrobia bacterium]|nr:PQQ-dependent sugar dehydrogenase [Verrucomicrobiota bacterium]